MMAKLELTTGEYKHLAATLLLLLQLCFGLKENLVFFYARPCTLHFGTDNLKESK